MKANPFAGGLPVELSDEAKRQVGNIPQATMLALLLANTAFAEVGKTSSLTLSLDTAAYAAGDVLADTQEIPGVLRNVGGSARLQSLTLIDLDDNTAGAIDLVFFGSNVSLGTENAAPSISDGNLANILGVVNIPSGNFVDLGGAKVATVVNIGLQVTAPAGTSIYVAAIARGTPTQTAAGIKIQFGFRQD